MALAQEQVLHKRGLDSKEFESENEADSVAPVAVLEQEFLPPKQVPIPRHWRVLRFFLLLMPPEGAHKASIMVLRFSGGLRGIFRSLKSG